MKREYWIYISVIIVICLLLFVNRPKKSFMHGEARDFTLYVKNTFPEFFEGEKTILDVGSADINGNNRFLFDESCKYNGNDVVQSENVTIVSTTSELPFEDEYFDTIISTECFEHDMNYKESFKKIEKMLKPGGLFVFTCASTDRPEHGTLRTSEKASKTTEINNEEWANYYKNLVASDVTECLNVENFSPYAFYTNTKSHDLYFWGIKGNNERTFTHYSGEGVTLDFEKK